MGPAVQLPSRSRSVPLGARTRHTAGSRRPLQRVRLETEAGRLQTAMEEAAQVIRAAERRLRNAQIAQLCALGADLQAAEAQLAALRPGR